MAEYVNTSMCYRGYKAANCERLSVSLHGDSSKIAGSNKILKAHSADDVSVVGKELHLMHKLYFHENETLSFKYGEF